MAGHISIKRKDKGDYLVLKHGQHVANIMRSNPGEFGHNPSEPWLLKTTAGRIDRFGTKGDATDEAHKI